MFSFENKVVLITGASRGIGAALAVVLDDLGAHLLLHAAKLEEFEYLKQKLKNVSKHQFFVCDFTEPKTVFTALESQLEKGKRINGFVNCVGLRARRPLKMIKVDLMEQVMSANYYSFVEVMRFVTQKKIAGPSMSIVSISSISTQAASAGVGLYAASKAAVEASIKSWSKELASRNIRVNAILCGQTNTEEYKNYFQNSIDSDKVLDRQFLGLNEPEEVANVIAFLLSDNSKIISGAMIPADGGYLS